MDDSTGARVCVLSSGSSGNCAVLRYEGDDGTRTVLIDAGLSPRRTRRLLEEIGLSIDHVDAVVLTHLDSDHWHAGWTTGWRRWMRPDASLHVHRTHIARVERAGTLFARPTPIEADFDLPGGTRVSCRLLQHDHDGVAAFRFDLPGDGEPSLGWVTDAGRIDASLVDQMRGVHVLAIESNYCPRLQRSSGRPDFLVRRVMGGAGHLSNQECREAIERIEPREHVVLLHLSRDCNRPSLVADLHAGADYALTIAPRHAPSRWVAVGSAWSVPPLFRSSRLGSGRSATPSGTWA